MAHSFRLIAKRDIRSGLKTIIGKGMSFEFVNTSSSSSPDSYQVKRAIKERYGVEVYINTVANDFEVIKL
jgi:hypothetical protein